MNSRYLLYLLFCFLSFNMHAKSLVIGTLSNDPPFGFWDKPHHLSGFDIDIMNAICKKIKRDCTYKVFNFHKLFAAVEKGEIDLAIAAIIITPERKSHFLFSIPYKINSQAFLVLANSKFDSPSQLYGKKIGIYRNSPEEQAVKEIFHRDVRIKLYNHVNELVDALKNKKVASVVLEYHRAIYWMSNSKSFKLLGQPFRAGYGYGIMARLEQNQLIQQINNALEQMEQDGSYLHIYQLYF